MKFSEKITYFALCSTCGLLSRLPLGVLYLASDILAWITHRVARYRLRVVMQNLRSSFPEKSGKELNRIASGFYRFLCDCFVESVKLYSMSDSFIRKHLTIEGIEQVNNDMAAGKNCSLMLGHYCNWEWVSSLPLFLNGSGVPLQVYHPMRNRGSNKFFDKLRTHFHAHNVPMHKIFQELVKYKRQGTPTVVGYIADQVPSLNIHLFVDFLNHDTCVFTGPERISRFLDANVYYVDITRPKRGYYNLRFVPITTDISASPTFEPTKIYFSMLEQSIMRAPQYWLWSHRRWKRTRERFNAIYGDKAAEQLSHL